MIIFRFISKNNFASVVILITRKKRKRNYFSDICLFFIFTGYSISELFALLKLTNCVTKYINNKNSTNRQKNSHRN